MKRAFTLVELLVVIAMIALLVAAIGTSVTSARERARAVKATAEVKEMTNAILAYENYARGGRYHLPTMEDRNATRADLAFILGKGETTDGGEPIPVLYNGSIGGDGTMRDPWGTPYKVTIREGNVDSSWARKSGNMKTGYALPNFNRLSVEERNQ